MIQRGVELQLQGLQQAFGIDTETEDFHETPNRVANYYAELFGDMHADCPVGLIEELLDKTFPSCSDQMVVQGPVYTNGICPHHLLPIEYEIYVGYLPWMTEDSRVLGLSKLARISDASSRRIVKQEEVGPMIADSLFGISGCKGAGCITFGRHMCMSARGVKQRECKTVTPVLRGKFLDEPSVKAEFLEMVKLLRNGG